MELIRNIQIGHFGIDPIVLSTTGVASCIAAVIELENKVFLYHVDPSNFNASATCTTDDAHVFLMEISNRMRQLDRKAIIKNVYLIGGSNDDNYAKLRNRVDMIREDYSTVIDQNRTLSSDYFHLFVNAIKLNLIGFNLPQKTLQGNNKNAHDDDDPNDYIVDFTIVYDRSSTPDTFVVYQYGGREYEMNYNRCQSLLLAMYVIDPTLNDIRAFICSSACESPYYAEFLNQVLHNVNNLSHIYESIGNDTLKKKLNNLLLRIKSIPIFDDE